MTTNAPVVTRTIAFLATHQKNQGRSTTIELEVPEQGMSARDLAASLELPLDIVEGVFHNYTVSGLDAVVRPGDRVTFVPYGTPASHPAFFGPFITRR
jgi:hypothetical protein